MLHLQCRLKGSLCVFLILGCVLLSFAQSLPPSTSFSIPFTQPITGSHIKMGVPLPQGASPQQLSIYDDQGMYVQADVFPLESWPGIDQNWVLVAFPAISQKGEKQVYSLQFDKTAPPQEEGIKLEKSPNGQLILSNFFYRLSLGPEGIQSIASASSDPAACTWKSGLLRTGEKEWVNPSKEGTVEVVYNGNLYKKIRLKQELSQTLQVYQEWDLYANSPYVHYQTRFINTSSDPLDLSGLVPLHINFSEEVSQGMVGIRPEEVFESNSFSIHQSKHDWLAALAEHDHLRGNIGELSEWVALELANGVKAQWLFPQFQEMATTFADRESVLSFKQNTLNLHPYKPLSGEQQSQVILPAGQARSFSAWMVINPIEAEWEQHASLCKGMPHVSYDRSFISTSQLLPEPSSGGYFDYFLKPLAERSSKTPTHTPDSKFPLMGLDYGWNVAAQDQLQRPEIQWDLSRTLIQTYLRLGGANIGNSAYSYALLQADRGANYSPLSNLPSEHPTSSDHVEGLLAAYYIWGEPWFKEAADVLAQKSTLASRGSGNAEIIPSLDFAQESLLQKDIKPSEESFHDQALYAYAQTLAYGKSNNPASFYLANAAWLGLIEAEQDAQTLEGSLPLVQGLPFFAGLARNKKLPFVVRATGEKEGSLSQLRMSPRASWDGKVFSFALIRTPEKQGLMPGHTGPLTVEVSVPVAKINFVKLNEEKVEFSFDAKTHILAIELAAAETQKSYQIEIGGR